MLVELIGHHRHTGLLSIVETARKALGVTQRLPHEVRAELHNLLVYKTGGHFAPHRDSEKVPGMFGTLVVVLPSAHEGGALVIRHTRATKPWQCRTANKRALYPTWFVVYTIFHILV